METKHFEVDVVIKIKTTLQITVDEYNLKKFNESIDLYGSELDRAEDIAAMMAIKQIREWDFAQESLGESFYNTFEISKPKLRV